jgi:hypothetical protein
VNAGPYPVIRSLVAAGAPEGRGLPVGQPAVFLNSDGDIGPASETEKEPMSPKDPEYDPEYPDDVPTTEEEGPIEVHNPNQNPETPALSVCQDTETPTTVNICNEGPGGGQITFPGPNPNDRPAIQSTPGTAGGIAITTPIVGGAVPPIPVVAVPPIAAGAAGAFGAGAATIAAAGAAAAAGALAGAAAGAAGIVAMAGIVAAPIMAFTGIAGGLPGALPGGVISMDPLNPGTLLNGPNGIVTMAPGTPPGTTLKKIKDKKGRKMKTSEDETNPYQISPILPGEESTIPSETTTFGSTEAGPTTIVFAGPCEKDYTMTWECGTQTMTHKIVDNSVEPATETTVMTTTPTSTDIPLLVTDGTTLIQQSTNPDSSNTVWYSSADPVRPMFGPNKLALYADTDPGGGGITYDYITLGERSTNPGGTTTLWAQTDHSINYGSNKIVFDPAPVDNNIAVYSGTTGQTSVTYSNSMSYLARPLTISTPGAAGTQRILLVQSIVPSGAVGMSLFNMQSGESGTQIEMGQQTVPGSSRTWLLKTGQSTNDFMIEKNSGTYSGSVLIIDDTGMITAPVGYTSKRYDVATSSANPGSTRTIWADSTTSDSLRYGAGNVLVDPAPTVANAIPVYTGTGGQVDTAATTTPATLRRPLTISAGNVTYAATINTTGATDCSVQIAPTGTGNNRASLTLGRTAFSRWLFGTDSLQNNTDDFFVSKFGSGVYAIKTAASDHLVVLKTDSHRRDSISLQALQTLATPIQYGLIPQLSLARSLDQLNLH